MQPETRSLLVRLARSLAMGVGLFALGALVQAWMVKDGVSGVMEYADDLILGLFAGLLVFAYEQRRHNAMLKRIRVIADMNHHVRNALQAITLSRYAENSQQIQVIDESAKRIQWALRELLPQTHEEGKVPTVGVLPEPVEDTSQSTPSRR
jgi:hypothetical protein